MTTLRDLTGMLLRDAKSLISQLLHHILLSSLWKKDQVEEKLHLPGKDESKGACEVVQEGQERT